MALVIIMKWQPLPLSLYSIRQSTKFQKKILLNELNATIGIKSIENILRSPIVLRLSGYSREIESQYFFQIHSNFDKCAL